MRPSPIQLLHVVYKRVCITESGRGGVPTAIGFDFQGVGFRARVSSALKKGQEENPQDFLIDLDVAIENKEGKPSPYEIDMSVLGVFKVLGSLPMERREDLVTVNGASILYGAIREMVLNVTSRFSAGPLTLPGMNFEDHAPSRKKPVVEGGALIVTGTPKSKARGGAKRSSKKIGARK